MILGLSVAFHRASRHHQPDRDVSGLVVLFGMLGSRRLSGWTALFLLATILTSVTGFLFPIHGFTPALELALCHWCAGGRTDCALRQASRGAWRWIYVVMAVTVLWLTYLC